MLNTVSHSHFDFLPQSFELQDSKYAIIKRYRAALVLQRSWVQIPYRPEIFFRSYLQLLVSVVFLAVRIF